MRTSWQNTMMHLIYDVRHAVRNNHFLAGGVGCPRCPDKIKSGLCSTVCIAPRLHESKAWRVHLR